MNMSNNQDNIISLISQTSSPTLKLYQQEWKRVNPKWSMVARVFINMLTNEEVIPRLATATTIENLKAVLFVDHYLTSVKNNQFRNQIRVLLSNDMVPLETIETYAALSFAREAIWMSGEDESINKNTILYSIEAAASQLNLEPEDLYHAILSDEINAELYLSRTEIERLQKVG
ncbi:MAG: hypothetical protein B6242_04095 [Anaerolineaceae bacterium 4572_78]|nr:MAG: hypothetical protein B6242_04095 [Anaerolineaceae bacterium 4572_78]